MSKVRKIATSAAVLSVALFGVPAATHGVGASPPSRHDPTATPIKHVVVIFQENVSFDHYFGTYPKATNASGEPFFAAKSTPKVDNLANTAGLGGHGTLLTNNPNPTAAGTR